MNLMRGPGGSMIVAPETHMVPGYPIRTIATTFHVADGRAVTYTPEPLRLTYKPTTPVPPSNAMRRG